MASTSMDLLKPLIALLAIVNPIGVVPFFLAFTQGLSRTERQRTLRVSAFSAFCVIAISGLAGLKIIGFFGISIASFQVGGGMLLLMSSLHMLNAQPAESGKDDLVEGQSKADVGLSVAVVPLTIPLLTGPATYAAFAASGRIARVLGRTGINVMTRLMGLILAAMAVELLADGLVKLFPILASPTLR